MEGWEAGGIWATLGYETVVKGLGGRGSIFCDGASCTISVLPGSARKGFLTGSGAGNLEVNYRSIFDHLLEEPYCIQEPIRLSSSTTRLCGSARRKRKNLNLECFSRPHANCSTKIAYTAIHDERGPLDYHHSLEVIRRPGVGRRDLYFAAA